MIGTLHSTGPISLPSCHSHQLAAAVDSGDSAVAHLKNGKSSASPVPYSDYIYSHVLSVLNIFGQSVTHHSLCKHWRDSEAEHRSSGTSYSPVWPTGRAGPARTALARTHTGTRSTCCGSRRQNRQRSRQKHIHDFWCLLLKPFYWGAKGHFFFGRGGGGG